MNKKHYQNTLTKESDRLYEYICGIFRVTCFLSKKIEMLKVNLIQLMVKGYV